MILKSKKHDANFHLFPSTNEMRKNYPWIFFRKICHITSLTYYSLGLHSAWDMDMKAVFSCKVYFVIGYNCVSLVSERPVRNGLAM